jgi:hypothetical protein
VLHTNIAAMPDRYRNFNTIDGEILIYDIESHRTSLLEGPIAFVFGCILEFKDEKPFPSKILSDKLLLSSADIDEKLLSHILYELSDLSLIKLL